MRTQDATQSELFELRARHEEDAMARASELELLITDAERANARIAALQKEVCMRCSGLSEMQTGGHARASLDPHATRPLPARTTLQSTVTTPRALMHLLGLPSSSTLATPPPPLTCMHAHICLRQLDLERVRIAQLQLLPGGTTSIETQYACERASGAYARWLCCNFSPHGPER